MISNDLLLKVIKAQTDIVRIGPDLGAIMDLVAELAVNLCSADGAAIELIEGDELVYRAVAGCARDELGLRIPADGSLSGLCVRTRSLQVCMDTDTDLRVDRHACLKLQVRSMLVMPLLHGDVCAGVIVVLSARPNAFNAQAWEVLQLLSDLVAAAMFHAAQLDENELYRRATRDALTGVANRAMFFDCLRSKLLLARRSGDRVGLLAIDVNDLKPINDRNGHGAGDEALKTIARILVGQCRKQDTVARVGGDEFVVVVPSVASRGALERLAQRIAAAVGRHCIELDSRRSPLSVSVGAAVFPTCAHDMDRLIELADQRMYEAKRVIKERRIQYHQMAG